jgi:hypothetical protein
MRLTDVTGSLTSAYLDWNDVLANPRYIRKGLIITWLDYSSVASFFPESYRDLVQLYEDRQYSLQFTDGSLLQFYYEYAPSGIELLQARLAFYKIDQQGWEFEEGVQDSHADETIAPVGDTRRPEKPPIAWVRIDYSPKSAKGVLHNPCHLHVSGFPSARIAVAGVPTPKQFLEFVMCFCYPDVYHRHRLDDHGHYKNPAQLTAVNSTCVPCFEEPVLRQITHLHVPGVRAEAPARRARRR